MEKKQLFKLGLWFRAKQIVKNIKSWSNKRPLAVLQQNQECDGSCVSVNTLQYV